MEKLEAISNPRNNELHTLLESVSDQKTKEYINNRLLKQMEWYSKKSSFYKQQYFRWMTVSIALGAAIPIAAVFADGTTFMKVLITTLGSLSTAINAYLALCNTKDLWMQYRLTRENLLRILYSYLTNIDIFAHKNTQQEKDALLISISEEELSRETGAWKKLLNGNSTT